MRNHTLMQTIARANRVFPGKNNGLIVDYVGVFRNLQKALAIYAAGTAAAATLPVREKDGAGRAPRAKPRAAGALDYMRRSRHRPRLR